MDLNRAVEVALGALQYRRNDLVHTQGDSDWGTGLIAEVDEAITVLTDMLPPG